MIQRFTDWLERRRARRITLEHARRRAGRGAAYLDDFDPGWHWRINLDRLELASGSSCVLGQLHGAFFLGLNRARLIDLSSAPRAALSPVRLGFLCISGVCEALQEQDYEYLNQSWHEEIMQRRGALIISPFPSPPPLQGEPAPAEV